MATVDGITAAKAAEIEGKTIASAFISSDGHLHILLADDVTDLDVGTVVNLTAISDHASLTTGVHGVVTGDVVGTGDDQTLTNKTLIDAILTTPAIASYVNALHTHANNANGGPLAIGKADNPAPVTTLTARSFTDADATANTAKVLASMDLVPGRWLILATCEGVTMPSPGQQTRFEYDLKTTGPTLNAKPVSGSSSTASIDGGRNIFGWGDFVANQTVTFTMVKNGAGGLITNSTTGMLIAIKMG